MGELFSNTNNIKLELDKAEVYYYPQIFNTQEANTIFKTLLDTTPWQQDDIKVFGKTYLQPRLTAFYNTSGDSYTYSNITMEPHPFTETMLTIKQKVEAQSKAHFNSCLLNLYRDGQDSNGWHADDEKELGLNPIIASVSFGESRVFKFRNKENKRETYKLNLANGSLLLMQGATQHYWQHQIPKTAKKVNSRINLTFRTIK